MFCFGLLCDLNARCPRNPAAVSLAKACSLWGLNTRPMAHRTIALASELKELQTPVQRSGRAETVGRPTSRSVHAASRPSASVRIPCWRLWVWATSLTSCKHSLPTPQSSILYTVWKKACLTNLISDPRRQAAAPEQKGGVVRRKPCPGVQSSLNS